MPDEAAVERDDLSMDHVKVLHEKQMGRWEIFLLGKN